LTKGNGENRNAEFGEIKKKGDANSAGDFERKRAVKKIDLGEVEDQASKRRRRGRL